MQAMFNPASAIPICIEKASIARRSVAAAIDFVLLGAVLAYLVQLSIFLSVGMEIGFESCCTHISLPFLTILIGGGIFSLAILAAQLLFIFRNGQSIGQRLVKIQVVESQNGFKCSGIRYIGLRLMPTVICIAVLAAFAPVSVIAVVLLLNAVFMLGANRQCVHDIIARTYVVNRPNG